MVVVGLTVGRFYTEPPNHGLLTKHRISALIAEVQRAIFPLRIIICKHFFTRVTIITCYRELVCGHVLRFLGFSSSYRH